MLIYFQKQDLNCISTERESFFEAALQTRHPKGFIFFSPAPRYLWGDIVLVLKVTLSHGWRLLIACGEEILILLLIIINKCGDVLQCGKICVADVSLHDMFESQDNFDDDYLPGNCKCL